MLLFLLYNLVALVWLLGKVTTGSQQRMKFFSTEKNIENLCNQNSSLEEPFKLYTLYVTLAEPWAALTF